MLFRYGVCAKASRVGAFFVLAWFWQPAAAEPGCAAPASATAARVSYVHDGDTLTLADKRKVRLIGINTPELAHDGNPTQPLAIAARDRLRQLLFANGNQALILFGQQKVDRYGRSLAHLWTADGDNLGAALLREGLGWAVAIPPNTGLLDCYLHSEQQARDAGRGVWQHPGLASRASSRLPLRSTGFQRIHGRVVSVSRGGGATWIKLEGRFKIRIPDEDLPAFSPQPDGSWVGRTLEVRGWLSRAKGELRITVQHPAAISLHTPPR